MEEKLYFKPASYGKGIKKKDKPEKPNITEKEGKSHRARNLILFLTLIVIIILIILWLLRGKTTTRGQYPENVRNESLVCESTAISYPKITRADSDKKELQISLIFYGEEELKSASLTYTLYYSSEEKVTASESFAHAEFNKGLYSLGFDSEKFSNKFARFSDRLVVSLFANASDINEYAGSYFMINVNDLAVMPKTIFEYQKQYTSQGFSCKMTKE